MKVELTRNELLDIFQHLGVGVEDFNVKGFHKEANELEELRQRVYEYSREAKYWDFDESDSLFTKEENEVLDLSAELFNKYAALPHQHPSDRPEVAKAVHDIQYRISNRIPRRAGEWPIYQEAE